MSEPTSRTIYAVTSGDYDWWDLDGLFERREDAEAAVAAGFGHDVTESRLYPAGTIPRRVDYWEASAEVTARGTPTSMDGFGGPGTGDVWIRPAVGWTGSGFAMPDPPRIRLSATDGGGTFISVQAMTEAAARRACDDTVRGLTPPGTGDGTTSG